MSVIDWLKRGSSDKAAPPPPPVAIPPTDKALAMGGLDFASALESHTKWKHRLESFIDGAGKDDFRPEVISRDDQCNLGRWLHGHGLAHFGYLECFAELRDNHARLHSYAGDIVHATRIGRHEDARKLLQHADYLRASERVKLTLSRLFVQVVDGEAAVAAHQRWKVRLRDFVEDRSREEFVPEEVVKDDNCALGQWLNGAGHAHYGDRRVFHVVKACHTHVHLIAGDIVAAVLRGERDRARQIMDEGDFAKASAQLSTALQLLMRRH